MQDMLESLTIVFDTTKPFDRSAIQYFIVKTFLAVFPSDYPGYDEVKTLWPGAFEHRNKPLPEFL